MVNFNEWTGWKNTERDYLWHSKNEVKRIRKENIKTVVKTGIAAVACGAVFYGMMWLGAFLDYCAM